MRQLDLARDADRQVGAVVVAARLLDRDGTNVKPCGIRSIEFSLFEVHADGDRIIRPAAGVDRARLGVDDVLFAAVQRNDEWTVDEVGYNFRHCIPLEKLDESLGRRASRFELRYVLTQITGESTRVCFLISRG